MIPFQSICPNCANKNFCPSANDCSKITTHCTAFNMGGDIINPTNPRTIINTSYPDPSNYLDSLEEFKAENAALKKSNDILKADCADCFDKNAKLKAALNECINLLSSANGIFIVDKELINKYRAIAGGKDETK